LSKVENDWAKMHRLQSGKYKTWRQIKENLDKGCGKNTGGPDN